MSLAFAAITPHPPLLLPTIGKEEDLKKLDKTRKALAQLEEDLYLSKPDTILVISSHNHLLPDAFTINMSPDYETDLRDFGDLTTKLQFHGEMTLTAAIREATKDNSIPTVLISEKLLDHPTAVPLFFLSSHLTNTNILPIGYSELDFKAHWDLGNLINDQIMNTNKRIAVIASGDLSHALTSEAPAGYNESGPEFDKKIQDLLANKNVANMLQFDPNFVKAAAADPGFRAILILMGIIHDQNYTYRSYCYEAPMGVGYLTANFII